MLTNKFMLFYDSFTGELSAVFRQALGSLLVSASCHAEKLLPAG